MEGRQPQPGLRSKQIKENLLLLFCSILHEYGPLSVNSTEFQQMWTSISTDQQNIIDFSGGLSNFLLQSNNISLSKPDILFLKKDISEDRHTAEDHHTAEDRHTAEDHQHLQTHHNTSNQIQTAKRESLSLQNIVTDVFGDVLTPDKNQRNTQNCPRQTGVSVTESSSQDICIDTLITEECGLNHSNRPRKKGRKHAKNKEKLSTKINSIGQSVTDEEKYEKPISNKGTIAQCQPGSSKCVPLIPSTYSMVAAKTVQSKKKQDCGTLSTSKKAVKMPPLSTVGGISGVLSNEVSLCSICHETLHSDKVNKLQCGHIYHDMCIRKWLEIQKTCPTCRVLVLLNDEFPPLSLTI